MIEMRRRQLSFGDGLIAEEVSDLREDWMIYADEVLADEEIVAAVYEAGHVRLRNKCTLCTLMAWAPSSGPRAHFHGLMLKMCPVFGH
jgi:hypothetical protein